ncbi:MAG: 3-phosphoshikimate 1-carboxyvinyltransferase [Candidatus Brocadiaceae bacterium]|jgi:3-phosphoshikimate 1-carboxyvinyltransferase
MRLVVKGGTLAGAVHIPGSKSHTIRALLIGSLAGGTSRLIRPLRSSDTESCIRACEALGAEVRSESSEAWEVRGTAGAPAATGRTVDVGNSGTTLFLALGAAALAEDDTTFTGDEQIQRRSAAPLLEALRSLGARAVSERGNGCAPLRVGGPLQGGKVAIECPTSQYLSSLLISCPLARRRSTIDVPLLNESPYVGITLQWLDNQGIVCRRDDDYSHFEIPGGQAYHSFSTSIPGDFSSATFFLVAAAVTGARLQLRGLDMGDPQGDKAVVDMLQEMGCAVEVTSDGVAIRGPDRLQGCSFDLNATPDALPAMAVAGCVAEGETRLLNVPQARMKETDRIRVMARELAKMGAEVEELSDGLAVRHSPLRGTALSGHGDHRVVMALAVAGLVADGATVIDSAESVSVTFPEFVELMCRIGAEMELSD